MIIINNDKLCLYIPEQPGYKHNDAINDTLVYSYSADFISDMYFKYCSPEYNNSLYIIIKTDGEYDILPIFTIERYDNHIDFYFDSERGISTPINELGFMENIYYTKAKIMYDNMYICEFPVLVSIQND